MLDAPNLTDAEVLNIWNSIGSQGNNPYIRIVNGSEDEAEALFNILAVDRQIDHAPSNPSIRFFNLDIKNFNSPMTNVEKNVLNFDTTNQMITAKAKINRQDKGAKNNCNED